MACRLAGDGGRRANTAFLYVISTPSYYYYYLLLTAQTTAMLVLLSLLSCCCWATPATCTWGIAPAVLPARR